MDYFTELLDSYKKLKKRTFKLSYILEQGEDPGVGAAQKAIDNAPVIAPEAGFEGAAEVLNVADEPALNDKGESIKIYKNSKTQAVIVTGMTGGRLLTVQGGQDDAGNFQKFANKLAGTEEPDGKTKSEDSDISARNALAAQEEFDMKADTTIGGAVLISLRDKYIKEGMGEAEAIAAAQEDWAADQSQDEPELMSKHDRDLYRDQLIMVRDECQRVNATEDKALIDNWASICADAIGYVAGGQMHSIERKLEDGRGICVNPKTGKVDKETTDKCALSAGFKQEALEGNKFLLSFLGPEKPGEDKCKDLTSTIGLHGEGSKQKVVFFGPSDTGTPTEGVVMNPNALQKAAINKIQIDCPDEGAKLENVLNKMYGPNAKNAIKGTIYEAVPQVMLYMRNMRMADNAGNQAEVVRIQGELSDYLDRVILHEKVDILKQVAEESQSYSTDTFYEQQQALTQLKIATSKKELARFLLEEARVMEKWLGEDAFGADTMIHTGLKPMTGGRADNNLGFKDPAAAKKAAKANGITDIQDRKLVDLIREAPKPERKEALRLQFDAMYPEGWDENTKLYLVPFGQKRTDKGGATKAGEVNRQDCDAADTDGCASMNSYFNEDESGGSVVAGFFKKLRDLMGFGPSQPAVDPETGEEIPDQYDEDPDFKALLDYNADLEAGITARTAKFTKNRIYKKENGELAIQSARSILTMMGKSIKGLDTWDNIKDSKGLATYFFHKDGTMRDFDNPLNRERITEFMQRRDRFDRLRKDMKAGGNKAKLAKEALLRNLLICGYNEAEMLQQKQTDDGTVKVWPHNAPMDKILEAHRKGNLKISIKPGSHFAAFEIGGKEVMRWKQEGTWSGTPEKIDPKTGEVTKENTQARQTRSTALVAEGYLDNPAFLKESTQASGTFYEFMIGQQRLLEKLINQAKTNRVL